MEICENCGCGSVFFICEDMFVCILIDFFLDIVVGEFKVWNFFIYDLKLYNCERYIYLEEKCGGLCYR